MPPDSLPRKPILHRGFRVMSVPGSSAIQLHSEGRALRLEPLDSSELLPALLPLLDGIRTIDEVVRDLSSFDQAQVRDSLHRLHEARLLEDAATDTAHFSPGRQAVIDSQLRFLANFVAQPAISLAEVTRSCVAVLGLGETGSALLTALAFGGVGRLVGIEVREEVKLAGPDPHEPLRQACYVRNADADYKAVTLSDPNSEAIGKAIAGSQLLVVTLDGPAPALLEAVNAACLGTDLTWMPAGVRAWEGFVGPLVVPGQTACYTCYDLRVKANLTNYDAYRLYESHLGSVPRKVGFGSLPYFNEVVAGLAATEVFKILTRFREPPVIGRLVTLDFLSLTLQSHEVLKLPRCPTCGEPAGQMPLSNPWVGSRSDRPN